MRQRTHAPWALALALGLSVAACKGGTLEVGDTNGGTNAGPNNVQTANNDVEVNPDVLGVPTVTLRRLSQEEFNNTVEVLLLDDSRSFATRLPEDKVDPFDNNGATQLVSQPLIEGLETAATEAATAAMTDPARRDLILGCTPTGADDVACFQSFVETFGGRAFRRPLTDEEVASFMTLHPFAVESGDFYKGATLVITAMLQMPDFVYHLQRGIAVDGLERTYRLNAFEVASRLSYFLWGSMPDEALLDAAAAGELKTSEQVRAQATRMIADTRTRQRIQRFHAMWLGYHRFSVNGTIGQAMTAESNELINRVVFEDKSSYFDLFTSTESFLNDELAIYYGLDAPGSEAGTWTDVSASGRGGILSHATFLSVASKFGDTSPTQRGRLIRERLLCTIVPPPDPALGVDTDMPPPSDGGSTCKKARYEKIAESSGCAACHLQMDPIGMGLENYSQAGLYRETDVDDENCVIDGEGSLNFGGEQMTFNGPRDLGEKLASSSQFEACVVKQAWQFAVGTVASSTDAPALAALQTSFAASGHRFDELLLDIVASESFLYRIEPEPEAN